MDIFQKREIPWEKVPFVPRPSLIPDPVTAFGKKKPEKKVKETKLITDPLERAKIRPDQKVLLTEPEPYVSARDATREKVLSQIRRANNTFRELPNNDCMDVMLPRLHKLAEQPNLPYKRRIAAGSELYY